MKYGETIGFSLWERLGRMRYPSGQVPRFRVRYKNISITLYNGSSVLADFRFGGLAN
jgi:hypothetical protein